MTNTLRAVSVLIASLLSPCHAIAQQGAPTSAASLEYRKWDLGGSFGIRFARSDTFVSGDESGPVWSVEGGRYLTTHVKMDAGFMVSALQGGYANPSEFAVPGLPDGYSYLTLVGTSVRPTTLAVAATYQFRENEFMHPYVSIGASTVWEATDMVRFQQTITINRTRYTVPAVDDRHITVTARPYVSGGFKSYFNERTFMRSELVWAAAPHGLSHATLRIGAGVDF